MKKILAIALLATILCSATAQAKLNVFACEPEWGSLLQELAGDAISIDVGTTALQDVHQIEAKPSLIAKVRRANIIVCTGADLEAGWLPQLIRQSGNAAIASGPGNFMTTSQVVTLEKPSQLNRANGDVHPQGNPHIQMDPKRVLIVAKALSARLIQLDTNNTSEYQKRFSSFSSRWNDAIKRWEAKAAPLKGQKIIVQHNSWVYLNAWLGLNQIDTLEPKPGVPPSSSHLASLITVAKTEKPMAIIYAAYQSPKSSNWLSERTGVPVVMLPLTVGGDAEAKDLFGLFDSTIDNLLDAKK